jgi:hypothetical protein
MSARTGAVLLTLVLLLTGCAEAGTPVPDETAVPVMPVDFAGTVDYGNGSVAPPYHYEWQVRFDEASAEVSWTPGYDQTQPWREHVSITADQREHLYSALRDAGVFEAGKATDDGMVGGPTGSVELTADGRTYTPGTLGTSEDGQRLLRDVVAAVEELVPADVWAGFEDRQDDWSRQQPK